MKTVTLILGPAGYLERLVALIDLAVRDNRAPLVFPRATAPDLDLVAATEEIQLRAIWRALPSTAEVWLVERPTHVPDHLSRLVHRLPLQENGGPRLTRSGTWDKWRSPLTAAGMEGHWRDLVDVPPEQLAIPGLPARSPS